MVVRKQLQIPQPGAEVLQHVLFLTHRRQAEVLIKGIGIDSTVRGEIDEQFDQFLGRTSRDRLFGPCDQRALPPVQDLRSEEHTSALQSRLHLVCRPLLEKKKTAPSTSQS